MKREIWFRGKRKDNGEWVEGDLVHNGKYCVVIPKKPESTTYLNYLVDPVTVGQYTGLYDTNGEPIFEGDIVEAEGVFGKIEYSESEAMFQAVFDGWCVDFDHFRGSDVEVIGNIHDNPELLEGENDNA